MITKNIIGKKYGRLIVLELSGRNKEGDAICVCLCECGKTILVAANNVKRGHTKSCGCLRRDVLSVAKTTHGMHESAEFKIWSGIKSRCLNKNNPAYKNYGARGITICDRWMNSFIDFFSDVGRRPSADMSIDRIDNDKGYEPGNVRWATRKEQARNRRNDNLFGGKRGGGACGERQGSSKLTEKEVREIRQQKGNITQKKLASMHGVSRITIQSIQKGFTWKCVLA